MTTGVLCKFTHDANQIKNVFSIMKELLVDVNMKFDGDGVSLCGVDPEKISITKVSLLNLNEYVKPFIDINFGVYTQSVYKVIRHAQVNDDVTFIVHNTTPLTMDISIESKSVPVKTTTRLTCIEIPVENIVVPENQWEISVEIPRKMFHSICKDLMYFSNKIEVQVLSNENNSLTLKSTGPLGVHSHTISDLVIERDGSISDIQQAFYIRHLDKFSKSYLNSSMTLHLGQNSPLVVKMSIPCTGQVVMCLAEVNPSQ